MDEVLAGSRRDGWGLRWLADAVALWAVGAGAEDPRLRGAAGPPVLVVQAPGSLSTHPLSLWSRWAWNSNWSWSTLGR